MLWFSYSSWMILNPGCLAFALTRWTLGEINLERIDWLTSSNWSWDAIINSAKRAPVHSLHQCALSMHCVCTVYAVCVQWATKSLTANPELSLSPTAQSANQCGFHWRIVLCFYHGFGWYHQIRCCNAENAPNLPLLWARRCKHQQKICLHKS